MEFLYDRQVRKFYVFLVTLCAVQICFMGCSGMLQARGVRRALVERELSAASYLLEQNIPPALIASAWNHGEVTKEGRMLLEKIGHTEESGEYLLLLTEQNAFWTMVFLAAEGALFAVILLLGAGSFLRRREQVYGEAEKVVTLYADGKFDRHLPMGGTGGCQRLFNTVEKLALSLQAKGEAECRAKEFLRDMISNISHQLKTPLAALDLYMEILTREPENAEAVSAFTQKSLRSLERMEQLIRSLLKMARLDTGSIVFEKGYCPVSEIAAQAVGELAERAKREQKQILFEGIHEERIFCDPEWTKEAVENLVKNALDHTDAGGVIRICWKSTPVILRLTVEDDGCGIAPEDIFHIFRRFYRSGSLGDRQGAGLGLPLAKAIVEGQGGSLNVESSPGEGSIFTITFPAL